ncbi:hypothetical protein [Pseudomonas sp. W4I3]|uniref:hypothetical protein n=1 Tax=Pseudomonas sp. W4I3 TaxID=3042294 RepID=UPI00278B92B2|nr:hypothetical protein [Pseudomonas sp. W4I3]MDQ0740039.1 hypothetical protein [Pseudomonas sp. W4I3]
MFNEALLDRDRLTQLLTTVREMAADAQLQLVQALKEAPPAVPTPPRRTGNKPVIKTPSGALVGRTRPRVVDQAGDIVDVIAPFEERTLASFHEHAPDVWVRITQPEVPVPPRVPYALAILKAQGEKAARAHARQSAAHRKLCSESVDTQGNPRAAAA